jgi:hypothetical protein
MIVLRIVLILAAVVVLDLAVLFFVLPDIDEGWAPVSRAIGTQYEHPSPENQRAVETALQQYRAARRPRVIIAGLSVLFLTGGGVFVIARELKRRRTRIDSGHQSVATPII